MAYYEGRSFVPDYKPMKILKSLIDNNHLIITNPEGLFDVNRIYFKKSDFHFVSIYMKANVINNFYLLKVKLTDIKVVF